MSSLTVSLPLPNISPEVRAFAEKAGVADYLPAVLAMTRRILPTWSFQVLLEDDPEIADDWHIVLEVQMPKEVNVDYAFALQQQWSAEVFHYCPSTYICVFRLGMV